MKSWLPISVHHITGVDQRRTFHAIDTNQALRLLKSRRKTRDSLCGKRVKPAGVESTDGQTLLLPWPCYDHQGRCRECWEASGKPGPNSHWRDVELAS